MQSITSPFLLHLNDGWTIESADKSKCADLRVPGDVHSALLASEQTPNPYWRDTEQSLDWIHEQEWTASTDFEFEGDICKRHILTFMSVDCVATVHLNDVEIGQCNSQFKRWDFDTSAALKLGKNALRVTFHSNSEAAADAAARSTIPTPYLSFNNRLPHYNFLRKTQCHAGWDWNIALSPLGFYDDIFLSVADPVQFDEFMVRQKHHENGNVTLELDVHFAAHGVGEIELEASICGVDTSALINYYPGENRHSISIEIDNPVLWWPVGRGEQILHRLEVRLGDVVRTRKIGFRDIKLDTSADEIGNRFAFCINGEEMFMRGANWIPADALPQNCSPETIRDRLQSAVDANMNMIRVWGGGQYEPDWFYDMCSEMGIFVWHDFMFACNLYPAHDKTWLKSVREEARYQIKRLSGQACMALWCGDNELVGALNWYDEGKADRDRYLAIYDRLNHSLEEAVDELEPDIPFWPSSPSVGPLNFSDGWHDDRSGDMHFWDVWHSSKDFEHYRTVKPRFCSEFGFQSFPSMKVIEGFTEPEDRNVSSKVMDVHQRNEGGNSRIVETISRYFRFPDGFENMVYLSQVSQSLAMKTSIEFWRAQAPRCMGTLYWQLNDTWPVASWSSLEYGGNWKLTHYAAKRFFAPILITAQPDEENGDIVFYAVSDLEGASTLSLNIELVSISGEVNTHKVLDVECVPNSAQSVYRMKASDVPTNAFLHFTWADKAGRKMGENDYLPQRPKAYAFETPAIEVRQSIAEDGGAQVTLVSDTPALFVTFDHGGADIYSDNCFTLLPNREKTIYIARKRGGDTFNTAKSLHYLKG
ncbi:beta-mannosidase [Maritalea porphyrae]|uniref:Beta-mannosidase B n=1 Tax=Maritalea porphyrae TaxID=880732 RepID=A0ABQ5UQ75_9HYPH|nr:glycoside hydrolase family 2 protein [Maritalea porphyrae]GLQ17353.1 beta-mannosidase [Maritalea porphyrae]